ncbi:MAG: hypothetical protein ACREKL_08830 [Chthoniobacterales bacterium]
MSISWNGGTPASDQYTQGAGFISIAPVNGGDPKGDGYFLAGLQPIPGTTTGDFTGLTLFSIDARVDAGNASTIFQVQLLDSTLTQAAVGTFTASSFTSAFSTQYAPLVISGGGNLAAVTYWRITGDGIASDSFRYSFDNLLVTVPEPHIVGLFLLGSLCVGGRRLVRACKSPIT